VNEAFIRAIVDSPGDDLPRLVYADWLDDRDDPRGAYLRAECEAVGTGDIARLKDLGTGLDPLWVARVSRPPIGVCCDHIGIAKCAIQLRPGDLDQVEQRFALKLPAEYRAFLLNYNGGRSKLNSLPHPEYDRVACELQRWTSLNPVQEPWACENLLWQIRSYRSAEQAWFHALIPLCAADAGHYEAFAIGYGAENAARVYHVWDFSLSPGAGEPRKVADSLGCFLALIRNRVEPSVVDPDEDSDTQLLTSKPQS
jgi:uncharacterized protein (TIGR02996 family)